MMKIMFICTGNICRSSMAEWLLKKKVEQIKKNSIEVYSSGIYAENGDMPMFSAIEVMKEYGVDLSQHKATNIQESRIEEMDLVLCATTSHKSTVCHLYPELKEKVYTIKEYVGYQKEGHDVVDMKDPWGYDIEIYRYCAAEIEDCLELLISKIK